MTTWILILTLAQFRGGAAINSVHGFQSEAACMVAAREWFKQTEQMRPLLSESFTARALCVPER